MKVFITWSGSKSRAVAEILRKWLPGVLQAVKPYFSPDDIAKGSRWYPEVAKELDASSVGLLCVTRENLAAPWLLFEAGALGKNLDKSKVCPLLFGVEPTDLTGPLSQFQGARFVRGEFKQVVKMINSELGEAGLPSDVLDNVFDMWWPNLEQDIEAKLNDLDEEDEGEPRSERDILEEVLQLSRRLARDARLDHRNIHPQAIDDLVECYVEAINACASHPSAKTLLSSLEPLRRPIEYIARSSARRRTRRQLLLDELPPRLVHIGEDDADADDEKAG